MKAKIAILPGDGVGPEIVAEAVNVLNAVAHRFGHDFEMTEHPVGGAAYDTCGDCLPDTTLAACQAADAILLGAVGGTKWDPLPPEKRPERRALLGLRAKLGLFANLRPAKVWNALTEASPLKDELVARGIDLLIVRELTGGAYFGEKHRAADGKSAYDTTPYSEREILRVARVAFEAARRRSGTVAAPRPPKVTSVDKANVLETSRLWRETVTALHASEYADVELEHMYVDNAAMQLVRDPSRFDVILTENMFGDILSDEASQITGSIGVVRADTRQRAGHRRQGDRESHRDDSFRRDDAPPFPRAFRRGGCRRARRGECPCGGPAHAGHRPGERSCGRLHVGNG